MMVRYRNILFFSLSLIICPSPAYSLSFGVSDTEWSLWPEYCRARFPVSGAGSNSRFADAVPVAEIEKWKAQLGQTWVGLHHYCAGIIRLRFRYKQASNREEKRYILKQSREDALYTLHRMEETDPLYEDIALHVAQTHYYLEEYSDAEKYLKKIMSVNPKYSGAYSTMSVVYQAQGKIDSAIAILEKGDKALQGKSSEIHYFLGLILVDEKKYEEALRHARIAYELGYPLPGLKNKLKKLGKWTP